MPNRKEPSSPFASLAALKDALPSRPADDATPTAPEVSAYGGKIVVAKTRAGRGGKTVTMVRGLRGDAAALDAIARELKRAMGCGAVVEGDAIVVQGEQGPRLRAWLEARGAKRIVIGS